MKAYVTKYALTEGIQEIEGEVNTRCSTMFSWGEGFSCQSAHGNDWHTTHEAARTRAEEMRVKKIASLEKQIAKLKKLTFQP